MSPQDSYVEVLTVRDLSVTVFEDKTSKEVKMAKSGHVGEPSSDMTSVLKRGGDQDTDVHREKTT